MPRTEIVRPGARLGRYQIDDAGSDRTGTRRVLAWDTEVDRPVELVGSPGGATDEVSLRRRDWGLRLGAMMNHPGVRRVFGRECLAGESYEVWEGLEGALLSDLLRAGGLHPWWVLELGLKLLSILEWTWENHQIVLGELLPEEIHVDDRGTVTLITLERARVASTARAMDLWLGDDAPGLSMIDLLFTDDRLAPVDPQEDFAALSRVLDRCLAALDPARTPEDQAERGALASAVETLHDAPPTGRIRTHEEVRRELLQARRRCRRSSSAFGRLRTALSGRSRFPWPVPGLAWVLALAIPAGILTGIGVARAGIERDTLSLRAREAAAVAPVPFPAPPRAREISAALRGLEDPTAPRPDRIGDEAGYSPDPPR